MPYAVNKNVVAPDPAEFRSIDWKMVDRGEVHDHEEVIWDELPPVPPESLTFDPETSEVREMTIEEKGEAVKLEQATGLVVEGFATRLAGDLAGNNLLEWVVEILGAVCLRHASQWPDYPAPVKLRTQEIIDKAAATTLEYYRLAAEVEGMNPNPGESEEDYLNRIKSKHWS